jgi:hypothetical protein
MSAYTLLLTGNRYSVKNNLKDTEVREFTVSHMSEDGYYIDDTVNFPLKLLSFYHSVLKYDGAYTVSLIDQHTPESNDIPMDDYMYTGLRQAACIIGDESWFNELELHKPLVS